MNTRLTLRLDDWLIRNARRCFDKTVTEAGYRLHLEEKHQRLCR